MPNPKAHPVDQDSQHPKYGFHCTEWRTIQMPDVVAWVNEDEHRSRNAHANVYRQHGNPTDWNRYLTLGLYVCDDCAEFDKLWSNIEKDPVAVHQAIWYQLIFHVNNDLSIPDKLNAWAVDFSHDFLEVHDPLSKCVDTTAKWIELLDPNEMETDNSEPQWTEVKPRGRRGRTKSPEGHVNASLSEKQGNPTNVMNPPRMMHELPNHDPGKNRQLAAKQDWDRYKHSVKPASRPSPFSTVPEDTEATIMEIESESNLNPKEEGSVSDSTNTTRTAAFPKIAVNDGTHRVNVKMENQASE